MEKKEEKEVVYCVRNCPFRRNEEVLFLHKSDFIPKYEQIKILEKCIELLKECKYDSIGDCLRVIFDSWYDIQSINYEDATLLIPVLKDSDRYASRGFNSVSHRINFLKHAISILKEME